MTTAPNNEAFEALGQETLDSLKLPENSDTLTGILLGHVVEGAVMSSDLSNGQTVTPLNEEMSIIVTKGAGVGTRRVRRPGGNIYNIKEDEDISGLIHSSGTTGKPKVVRSMPIRKDDEDIRRPLRSTPDISMIGQFGASLEVSTTGDNNIKLTVVNSNSAYIILPDIMACNGYIHAIDAVLLPPKPETSMPSRKPTLRPTPRSKSSKAKGRKSPKSKAPKRNHNMFEVQFFE